MRIILNANTTLIFTSLNPTLPYTVNDNIISRHRKNTALQNDYLQVLKDLFQELNNKQITNLRKCRWKEYS